MKLSSLFNKIAKDFNAHPDHWTQKAFARAKSSGNRRVAPLNPKATCWCTVGAVMREFGINRDPTASLTDARHPYFNAVYYLERAIPGQYEKWRGIAYWNDMKERTVADVVRLFRRAARLAKEEDNA